MASERTFLSWIRTSLALVSAGVGVTQLFKLVKEKNKDDFIANVGKPIGGECHFSYSDGPTLTTSCVHHHWGLVRLDGHIQIFPHARVDEA